MNSGAMNEYSAKKEKLFNDIGGVVSDAGDVLKDAANVSVDKLYATKDELRDGIKVKVADAKARLDQGREAVKQFADTTNQYVSDNPWKVIGVAAVAALVVGFLLRRD